MESNEPSRKRSRVRFAKIQRDIYVPSPELSPAPTEIPSTNQPATARRRGKKMETPAQACLPRMLCRFHRLGCSYYTAMKVGETDAEFRKRAASNCWNHEERKFC
jgi:hypothetical protein